VENIGQSFLESGNQTDAPDANMESDLQSGTANLGKLSMMQAGKAALSTTNPNEGNR
jgi:hypothetical protein